MVILNKTTLNNPFVQIEFLPILAETRTETEIMKQARYGQAVGLGRVIHHYYTAPWW